MAVIARSAEAPSRSDVERGISRTLRRMDLVVLGVVWMLCVFADWSTGTKIALNLAAVAVLCLKELAFHQWAVRGSSLPVPAA